MRRQLSILKHDAQTEGEMETRHHPYEQVSTPGSIERPNLYIPPSPGTFFIFYFFALFSNGDNEALLHCVVRNRLAVLP